MRRDLATELDAIGRAVETTPATLCGSCAVVLGRKKMTLEGLCAEVSRYAIAKAS